MELDQIVTFIRTVPIFHFLEPDHLQQLSQSATVRDVAATEQIVARGSTSSELFIMVQGEAVAVVAEEKIGFERELKRFYPGDYFGMSDALTGERAETTVRAVDNTKTIVVTRSEIDRLFDATPAFARAVCRSLACFLRDRIIRIPAIRFERLDSFPELKNHASLLPARISQYCQALVVDRDDSRVTVGIVNPSDTRACDFIKDVLNQFQVEFVAISNEDFHRHAPQVLNVGAVNIKTEREFAELAFVDTNGRRAPIAETDEHDVLAKALGTAIRTGASDIHMEPTRQGGGRIRLRLDGKLLPFRDDISASMLRQMTSRLKVMANLDITNARLPQDGRFMVVADDRQVEFRESVMPCQGGEKTVLRVVAPEDHLGLDSLFVSDAVAHFAREIFLPDSGLVLVTGPTGCGKTTTLYAALQMLHLQNSTNNIVTVEDPVEYALDFATQIQVDDHVGLSFANILRSILRQDPDIILVGEIRDRDSAAIAVEAAATGHLVLSSLHTHSAFETLARLRNLEVPSYMLADALRGVVSQKLLPRVHPAYSEAVDYGDPIVERLRQRGILDWEPSGNLRRGRKTQDGPDSGESGRVAMFEFLSVSDHLAEMIERQDPRAEIERCATPETFFPFAKYARLLLEGGHVSPEQIERVLPRQMSLAGM